jgi:hypothetical protein
MWEPVSLKAHMSFLTEMSDIALKGNGGPGYIGRKREFS